MKWNRAPTEDAAGRPYRVPESAYEQCIAHEMTMQEIAFRLQVPTPVEYKGLRLDCACKADVVVHERVIVEPRCATHDTGDEPFAPRRSASDHDV
jgi:hypothetical protein